VNSKSPSLSGRALETLAKEYIAAENIIDRISNRYDETVLRAIITLPEVSADLLEDLDSLEKWTEQLSTILPKTNGDRATNGNANYYMATFERGDPNGEGVRIAVEKQQHGVGDTRYIPREFFDTNEYRYIMEVASKFRELLGEDAYIQRGDKRTTISLFGEAIDWLMNEARRGLSIQRYKGLGEMNPDQLWDTTVNPKTRRLMQVKIEDVVKADEIFTTLMGDEVEPRREFIERNALTVSNLDV
jgi:DNA gyrase subunit B